MIGLFGQVLQVGDLIAWQAGLIGDPNCAMLKGMNTMFIFDLVCIYAASLRYGVVRTTDGRCLWIIHSRRYMILSKSGESLSAGNIPSGSRGLTGRRLGFRVSQREKPDNDSHRHNSADAYDYRLPILRNFTFWNLMCFY